MSGWSASKPKCPVDVHERVWIEQRWAWLTGQFGLNRARSGQVVLPTPEFFPDEYTSSDDSVQRMLDRVCGYMDIPPETVDLSLYEDTNPVFVGAWRQGTAGVYQQEEGRYRIWVEVQNVRDPLALVATLAHELGHVHLLGHGRISPDVEDHEPLTDLLTVYLGMGVFSANAVIHEAYWEAGVVSGWSMGRRGYLSMDMFGYALARFAHTRDEEDPLWAKHLRPDVRSAFRQAMRFIAASRSEDLAAHAVLDEPEEIATDSPPTAPEDEYDPSVDTDELEPKDDASERPSLTAEELLICYEQGIRDFHDFDLQGLELCDAGLAECNFSGVDLSEADLTHAVLIECDLSRADLQESVLCGTILRSANLRDADLSGANLTGADLSGADIRGADFREAGLAGCNLSKTRRDRTTDFTDVDLSQAVCDAEMDQEDLRGTMLTDRFHAWIERSDRSIAYLACLFLAVMIGGCIGVSAVPMLLGPLLGDDDGSAGFVVGAVLSGILAMWKMSWHRKSNRPGAPECDSDH